MEYVVYKRIGISTVVLYIFLGIYLVTSLVIFYYSPKYAPFIVVLLCFIPVVIYLLFSNINSLFLLYIACIPLLQHFSFLAIEVGDFQITPHMIVQALLFISLLSDYILSGRKDNYILMNVDKAFLMFVLFSIVPLMVGYTFNVNHVKRWLLFYTGVIEPILFYVSLRLLLHSAKITIKEIVIALLCTSFASVIVAFVEFRTIGFDPILIYASRMRFGFGYHNTNLFGIHSAILFPITVYALTDKRYSDYRFIAVTSFIILLLLSVICFNRGTFIVLGLQILILYFRRQNRPVIYLILISAIVLGFLFRDILLLYILRFIAGGGSETKLTFVDNSAIYRIDAWRVGLLVLFNYPFGVGAGSFQYMYEMYGSIKNLYLGTPHQLLLSIGVDYGVPCLVVFIVILFIAIRKSKELYADNKENNSLFYYVIISFIGYFVYGLITDGELSHLSGSIVPNNGYTLFLFSLIAIVVYNYAIVKSSNTSFGEQ